MKQLLVMLLLFISTSSFADANPDLWPYVQERMFGERVVVDADSTELLIDGPARASSGAQVPISITVDTDRFVKLYIIIDGNPIQHAATFMLTKHTQQTKISTRIRMETDSYVRVVGETANGKLFMSAVPIRASGGCSGYMDSGDPALTKDLGKILFKKKGINQTTRIKHPMFTGLQKDSINGWFVPEWSIRTITWTSNDEVVLQAETHISISQDPYVKFTYDGEITGIHAIDNKDNEFTL